jgi:hypothetical protein
MVATGGQIMTKQTMSGLMAGVLCLLVLAVAVAAPDELAIPWWTVDGGGGVGEQGDYTLVSTVGQLDVSPQMSGGDYSVVGGLREGALPAPGAMRVYLPLVLRHTP